LTRKLCLPAERKLYPNRATVGIVEKIAIDGSEKNPVGTEWGISMEFPKYKKPLDQFPVIRTGDVNKMEAAIGQHYGEVRLSVAGSFNGFHAHGNHCQLNYVGISYASYGAAVDHFYPDLSSYYAVPFAVAGSGWGKTAGRSVDINSRQTVIGSPGSPAELHCGPGFEELSVQLDVSAVRRTLAGLTGVEVNGELTFDPVFDLENPVNQLWWRLLRFLINEVEAQEPERPFAAFGEIEQALIVMFLKANRHRFSRLLEERHLNAAPRQVRLAEEYIEAHWDQPIKVENLAQLTNVSARSIFDSFQKSRGYSPMMFVKRVRLRHARRMLLASKPGTTVAKVASMCGFGNLGNFAKDYRDVFGELPSHTLRRAPGSSPQELDPATSRIGDSEEM
jgi:AraC-like DNA-binding protein